MENLASSACERSLRKKIEAADPGCERIAPVYGVGYRFDAPE
jgi:DNA-binding response OmpR family regulator